MFFWVLVYFWVLKSWGEKNCETRYEISKYEKNQCFVELNWKYYLEDIYLRMITWSANKKK